VKISDEDLNNLEVYEGQGWTEIKDENDPNLVDAWRIVIEKYKS
jgi:hypothetical protein